MTLNSEVQYLGTHHHASSRRNCTHPGHAERHQGKYLVQEGDGQQGVRYGFQDGSTVMLLYELHGVSWDFLYAETVNE